MKLKINKEFADKFNSRQKKLELQKLQEKYKNGDYLSESSTSESEDDNAEALTEEIEKDWFCTLSAIIGKDPKIYDPNVKFYHDESTSKSKIEKKKRDDSVFLKDYERKIILEHEGKFPDANAPYIGLYNKEQNELKEGFKSFLESSDDEGDIMLKRDLTNLDKENNEKEYIEWMKGQKDDVSDNITKDLVPLKSKWSNANIDDDDKFLKDYLLNKRYLDDDDKRVPTYEEIVLAEADEEQFEKEEIFELKYNYRFEEPDQDFIKSYPRTITDTVRTKDDKRAQKRKDVKDRKDLERKKKKEELKKLKNLKKDEMLSKLNRLEEVIGRKDIQLNQEDLEADFDPCKHEEVMRKLLGDAFYNDTSDHKKPTFYDKDIDDEEIKWDYFTREDLQDYIFKNDYEDDVDEVLSNGKSKLGDEFVDRSRQKRKRRSKFLDAIEKTKPLFDPDDKTFDEYFDEYYNLDYEDIIADQPCRFRYRNVLPNDFGLSTDEILRAREKELNAWVSVKKMSQYRTQNEELEDLNNFKKKSKKKYRIITSLNESISNETPNIKGYDYKDKKLKNYKTGKFSDTREEKNEPNLKKEKNINFDSINLKIKKPSNKDNSKKISIKQSSESNILSKISDSAKSKIESNSEIVKREKKNNYLNNELYNKSNLLQKVDEAESFNNQNPIIHIDMTNKKNILNHLAGDNDSMPMNTTSVVLSRKQKKKLRKKKKVPTATLR